METPRISLRPFNLSDAEDVLQWAGNDDVTRYLRWAPVKTVEEAQQHILNKAIPHPWRPFHLYPRRRSFDRLRLRQTRFRRWSVSAHLGYAVAREFWGKGIATAAVRMAVNQAFEDLPAVVRLQAVVEVENKASQRVLEKAGFQKEGLLKKYGYCEGVIRDMFLYGFVKDDC